MQDWDLRRLQKYFETQLPHSLYFLVGEEVYLVNETLKLLRKKIVDEATQDFNYDLFFAGDCTGAQIRDAIETLPMMSPRRLVIVRGADKLNEQDWEALNPVLDEPLSTVTAVFVADKVDRRKKSFKKIQESGIVVDLRRPFENHVPLWIDYIAFQHNLTLSREGISAFQQWVGLNLMEINNEMGKLNAYMGERRKVELADIEAVVSRSRADSIFDLTDAIGRQDRARALSSLAQLLDQGQNEIGAVAMFQRHVRILAKVKVGLRDGLTGQSLSAAAGIPQFFLKQYVSQAQNWSDDKINDTLEALYQTDKALKSSPVSSHIWLENFILHTCQV